MHLPVDLAVGSEHQGKVVRWFDRGFGFGFIAIDGAERDVFVAARNVMNADILHRGDRVKFSIMLDGSGRLQAADVELLGGVKVPRTVPRFSTDSMELAPWE